MPATTGSRPSGSSPDGSTGKALDQTAQLFRATAAYTKGRPAGRPGGLQTCLANATARWSLLPPQAVPGALLAVITRPVTRLGLDGGHLVTYYDADRASCREHQRGCWRPYVTALNPSTMTAAPSIARCRANAGPLGDVCHGRSTGATGAGAAPRPAARQRRRACCASWRIILGASVQVRNPPTSRRCC